MALKMQTWTKEQVVKMNEEGFLIDLLDTLKISPEIREDDDAIELMKSKLESIEARINARLDSK
ncbi:hypothetical protein [Marinobacterium jannaschii]|uniref:hypothetical protein n=1 Tax=Marinobacterium jannaschii TaxID=64970 RepID=UPI000486BD7C|nr:hypothetical protein [Marinobacterium jannaschii]